MKSNNAMNLKYIISFISFLIVQATYGQKIGDFETWDSLHINFYNDEMVNVYRVPNPMGGIPKDWRPLNVYGITRTSDSYSEDFAIILHNWYSYIESEITYSDELSEFPTSISGYYKYLRETGLPDSIQGVCELVVFNQHNESVKALNFKLDTCTTYKYFEFPIDHLSNELPGSIKVTFRNSNSRIVCLSSLVCNFLYLDKITLKYKTNTTNNAINNIKIYPNPVGDLIEIAGTVPDGAKIEIVNENGKIYSTTANAKQINVSHLSSGVYFIKVFDKGKLISTKKVIKIR